MKFPGLVDSLLVLFYIKNSKMIEKIKIDEIVTTIANAVKPKRIILFGSYALETANDESDPLFHQKFL